MKNIFVIVFECSSDKVDDFAFENREEAEKYLKEMQNTSANLAGKYYEASVRELDLCIFYKNKDKKQSETIY